MRVGIDFHSAEREGTGNCTYIRNLVEALLKIDRENEYFLYITDENYSYYERFKQIENVHLRLVRFKNPFIRILLLGIKTFIDEIDVLHVQYIAPPVHRGKLILTIHDVSFLHFPKCFRKFERIRLKFLIPLDIKRAFKILTISNHSKKDISTSYEILSDKIEITSLAAKDIFRPLTDLKSKKRILENFGIRNKFIFYLGRIDERKNITMLLKAFVLLKQVKNISHQLVIAGKEDFLPEKTRADIKSSSYFKDIIFTDYLSEKYIPIFYNLAEVFAYPSLYEGFGLPCLEAMSCGCPVVAANTSSIPEVVDGAGILVAPNNYEELAWAIYKIISDPITREEFRRKSLKRVSLFSWSKTAEKTLEIYEKAVQ